METKPKLILSAVRGDTRQVVRAETLSCDATEHVAFSIGVVLALCFPYSLLLKRRTIKTMNHSLLNKKTDCCTVSNEYMNDEQQSI